MDIRDKVYALHGSASNSEAIAINYSIDPKDLLTELIYHTCSTQASKTDMNRSRRDLFRFSKLIRDALKVICTEEELKFHISVARGDGISTEKDYGLRVRGGEMPEKPRSSNMSIVLPNSTLPAHYGWDESAQLLDASAHPME